MKKETEGIWQLPVYFAFSGTIMLYLSMWLIAMFATTTDDSGEVMINNVLANLIQWALFVLTILAGGLLFCRKKSRRSVGIAATVIALYSAILPLLEQLLAAADSEMASSVYVLMMPLYGYSVISSTIYSITGVEILSYIALALWPYVFVLFGKASGRDDAGGQPDDHQLSGR